MNITRRNFLNGLIACTLVAFATTTKLSKTSLEIQSIPEHFTGYQGSDKQDIGLIYAPYVQIFDKG